MNKYKKFATKKKNVKTGSCFIRLCGDSKKSSIHRVMICPMSVEKTLPFIEIP
jgi:hypothetical protein